MILLGTGLSGLVGSRIVELLGSSYEFEDISRKTGTDITDATATLARIKKSSSAFVLHFAAYTNVEQAEKDKALGEKSDAWQINVIGTQNVIAACERLGKKLIAISTDMVFPGDQALGAKYNEEDQRGPTNWYATTKYEAELRIEKAQCPWTILRIAYPYRASYTKNDSVRIFLSKLRANEKINAVTDHYFTPTFIDDIAPVLQLVIEKNLQGKFHVVGDASVSPYQIATAVAKSFDLDSSLITKTTREAFFKDRAKRPFNLSLRNARIKSLGVSLHAFADGLQEVKKQLEML